MSERSALLVVHVGRADIRALARDVIVGLTGAGFEVRLSGTEIIELGHDGTSLDPAFAAVTAADGPDRAKGTEICLVLGGDGTFLRAAEDARVAEVPLLGVNLGHVGFLAEAEPDALEATVAAIVDRHYDVEERMVIQVAAFHEGRQLVDDWALNEASVEKSTRERMLEVEVSVDDRPLTRFGCDGVICATPTGSTAYAYSVGGPIIWPNVEALLVVPNAAHALFQRPLVVAPTSHIDIELGPEHTSVLSCDGRRTHELPPGTQVRIERAGRSVKIARPHPTPFGERLVAKFQLPVRGFRDRGPTTL